MNIRKIPIVIENEYVKGAGVVIGASGSHDDVALKIHFGEMWDGVSKSVVWKDATRGNAVTTLITSSMLDEDGDYVVIVPNEPKAFPGEIFVSFKGYEVQGDVETAAVLTAVARFTVVESEWDEDAEASQAITPSVAEQLQREIENVYTKAESDSKYVASVPGKGLSSNDYSDDDKASVVANTAERHSHSNKSLLDGLTSEDISNWNAKMDEPEEEGTAGQVLTTDGMGGKRWETPSGGGDMLKSSYDTQNTGNKVDTALNAEKLDGHDASYFGKQSEVTLNSNARHSHSNKSALDTIPSGGVVTTLGNDDTTVPTSKAVAEALGQAGGGDMMKSSYDTTNTGNKVDTALNAEKLDGQNASYYGKQSEVSQNTSARHTHSNKSLLDTYSQSESDLADAVSKKHDHSNKVVLDGITSDDVAKWNSDPVWGNITGDISSQSDLTEVVSPLINLWDEQTRLGYYSSSGEYMVASNQLCSVNLCKCEGGKSYFFNFAVQGAAGITNICWYDANKAFISRVQATGTGVYTAPNNAKYFAISLGATYGTTYNHDISINYPSTYTGYYPSKVSRIDMPWADLLWENASPTSAFAGQDVSVDLSNYSFACLDAIRDNADARHIIALAKVGDGGQLICLDANEFNMRLFTTYQNRVNIGAGQRYPTYGSASVESNTRIIPVRIYGIK